MTLTAKTAKPKTSLRPPLPLTPAQREARQRNCAKYALANMIGRLRWMLASPMLYPHEKATLARALRTIQVVEESWSPERPGRS